MRDNIGLHRGKRIDNNAWIYGYYFYDDFYKKAYITIGNYCIRADVESPNKRLLTVFEVIPETVGQYTGLTDKNGKKIFEGDIVKSCEYDDVYFVKYFDDKNYPAFDCVPDVPLCECNGLSFLVNTEGCEIIGNIHDNPELSRGKGNG